MSYFARTGQFSRAWSTVRQQGVPILLRKTSDYFRRERELARQVRSDANRVINKIASSPGGRGLFLDCGSNLGQGFSYFERRYPLRHFDFILIEPNPYCLDSLNALIKRRGGHIELIPAAASTRRGQALFYGLSEDSRGRQSDAGSIIKEHNTILYRPDPGSAISVDTFSLSELVAREAKRYASIVMKLDIEGAECDVLEDMLSSGVASALDVIYVEFHSHCMEEPSRSNHQERERQIVSEFERREICYRLWH